MCFVAVAMALGKHASRKVHGLLLREQGALAIKQPGGERRAMARVEA